MDEERFPRAAAYLARLPDGVRSYPACQVKASVLREVLSSRLLTDEDVRALPEPMARLVLDPPPVSTWMPEVIAVAVMNAIRDRAFPAGSGGLQKYRAWTYDRNRRLLAKPHYRALFLLLSPEWLLRGSERRWGMFRRGSSAQLTRIDAGDLQLRTSYPPYLHDETMAIGLAAAFQAIIELAGGHDAVVDVREVGETSTEFSLRYRS
ncbi:MAG: hypothetical protein AB7S26_25765 [Sandaracinaceae bacterium]